MENRLERLNALEREFINNKSNNKSNTYDYQKKYEFRTIFDVIRK